MVAMLTHGIAEPFGSCSRPSFAPHYNLGKIILSFVCSLAYPIKETHFVEKL